MNEIEAVGAEASAGAGNSHPTGNERPWLYSFLIGPSALVANGVIQGGVLAYLLSQQGVGSNDQSKITTLLALPTSLYFLWSPITDFFVRRRTWLLAGGLAAAVLMAAGLREKLGSHVALGLMLASACCAQLVVSSCGGMMGAMKAERPKRVAGSFYQAGSMGFGALGAWVLLWLSSRVSADQLALTAAGLIGLPALFALAAPAQETLSTASFQETMHGIWIEFRRTFWRWEAVPYILCMTFPMASGSAVGLLSGVAKDYGVSGDSVAWVNGLMGGLLMAAGSAVAAALPVRVRAPVMYMIVALVNCVPLCILSLGPLRPSTYYVGVLLYVFTAGTCYAMFTVVVLEFMGRSGRSGSGRYSIINSLGNVPVLYMMRLDGMGAGRWGARGLTGTEAVLGGIGATVLLVYFLGRRPASTAIEA